MFSDYFAEQNRQLKDALIQNLESKGVHPTGKERDLSLYSEFNNFLKSHLPDSFSVGSGKVRNRKHILNRTCDLLLYRNWSPKIVDMTGGYVLSDLLYAVVTLERELSTSNISTSANLTNALKTLYSASRPDFGNRVIPMYSILFAYGTADTLINLRSALLAHSEEKEIALNHEIDMICVLDHGLILKDWEQGGNYRVVETGEDTLMWFFVLLMEYLDREGEIGLDLRDYIRASKVYPER